MDAILKKLQFRDGDSLDIINEPPGLELAPARGDSGRRIVLVFVADKKQLSRYTPKKIASDALLWIAYPKGSSKVATDLNRDLLWREMDKRGFTGVSLVAIDDTWSAMRFKPQAKP